MSGAAARLVLEEGQRELLESVARSGTSAHRLVQRARVLLAAADGVSNSEIAARVGVSRPTVLAWRAEFAKRGLWRFGQVAPGRGRKPSIPQATIDRVVELTLRHRPADATHWSVRSMAREVGISPATVARSGMKIVDDQQQLLAFCDFPAGHWVHLKTTNPIESTFATVRLRTDVTKGPGSRAAGLAMAYKLLEAAQDRWRAVNGPHLVRWYAPAPRSTRGSSSSGPSTSPRRSPSDVGRRHHDPCRRRSPRDHAGHAIHNS